MLTVEEFRKKYPGSSEEQVALYGAAVAAELADPPKPEPDLPMPMVTVPAALPPAVMTYTAPSQRFVTPHLGEVPPPAAAPTEVSRGDLTSDIRRIVLGRRLSSAERAQAERPDMSGDDLLALLAGVPNAREFEALEGD